ncbi:hypothetical protein QZH56_00405 [Streptomyces olivoreticuli]|uniref:hypothetical protein n=1 Tax=Streptomyces olivoreticuli TaxID=68246 RepID=UPI002659A70F|nr:hypothetical protein [Streptomyces olivoreticuli]WKK24193.1 hypothetical protein QZH56_00405 [Streptomyces olivoreticuli]
MAAFFDTQGGLFHSTLCADGENWSDPTYWFFPQIDPQIVWNDKGEAVLYSILWEETPGQQLLLSFLDDEYVEGKPKYHLIDIKDIISNTIVSDQISLIPLKDTFYALIVQSDGKLHAWTIDRGGADSAPRIINRQGVSSRDLDILSVHGGFQEVGETSAKVLTHASGSLWVQKYEYDEDTGEGVEFSTFTVLVGNGVEPTVRYQESLAGGHIVYANGRGQEFPDAGWWMVQYRSSNHLFSGGVPLATPEFTQVYPLGGEKSMFFACDSDGSGLRLEYQDEQTHFWTTTFVRFPGEVANLVDRYLVSLAVEDRDGAPVPNCQVTLAAPPDGHHCEIIHNDEVSDITHDGTTFTTDGLGMLHFTVPPDGLFAPELLASSFPIVEARIVVSAAVREYLAGEKDKFHLSNPEGPLERFDNQGEALVKQWPEISTDAARKNAPLIMLAANPDSVAADGFMMQWHSSNDCECTLMSAAEILEAKERLVLSSAADALWWNPDLGDVWRAIKHGVAEIESVIVDTADKLLHLGVRIGNSIHRYTDIAWNGVKELGHIIEDALYRTVSTVEEYTAKLSDFITWLRAAFNLDHIRNTQKALTRALERYFESAQSAIAYYTQRLEDEAEEGETEIEEWFSKIKEEMEEVFSSVRDSHGDSPVGQPYPVEREVPHTAEMFTDSHTSWMLNKVKAHPPNPPGFDLSESDLEDLAAIPVEEARPYLESMGTKLKGLKEAEGKFLESSISQFLDIIESSVLKAIDLGVDILKAVLKGISSILTKMQSSFEEPLHAPWPLGKIWEWVAGPGVPLNGANLTAMTLAFPCTIFYKVAVDDHTAQPFPPDPNTKASGPDQRIPGMAYGILQVFPALFTSYTDWYEVSEQWKDPEEPIAPSAVKILGQIELGAGAILAALLIMAEFGTTDAWEISDLAIAVLLVLLIVPIRFIKRFFQGPYDWIGGIAQSLLGLVAAALAIRSIAKSPEGERLIPIGSLLTTAPDTFGCLTSIATDAGPELGVYVLGGKVVADLLDLVAIYPLTRGYYEKPSLPN